MNAIYSIELFGKHSGSQKQRFGGRPKPRLLLAVIRSVILVLCMLSPVAAANLVVNGSFEANNCGPGGITPYWQDLSGNALIGWFITSVPPTVQQNIAHVRCYNNLGHDFYDSGKGLTPYGRQFVELWAFQHPLFEGPIFEVAIQQTITGLTPGQTYMLSFAISSASLIPGQPTSAPKVEVSFPSGSSITAKQFTAPDPLRFNDYLVWATKTMAFIATNSSVILQFKYVNVPMSADYALGLDNVEVVPSTITPPTASFTFTPLKPEMGEVITFDASSSVDPDGQIVQWEWNFGDGASAKGQRVTHKYPKLGEYSVTLTVTDNTGLTASSSSIVKVQCGGTAVIWQDITDLPRCPPEGKISPKWGSFGRRSELVAENGDMLELECSDGGFELRFTPKNGVRRLVGGCPFEGGCNWGSFGHPSDKKGNRGQPACFVGTDWTSADYGVNDLPNPWTIDPQTKKPTEFSEDKLDWAEMIFDARSGNLLKSSAKYYYASPLTARTGVRPWKKYCQDGAKAEGPLASLRIVDPPIGPETDAFFGAVFDARQNLPPGEAMGGGLARRCDLNGNGVCDEADFQTFQDGLGACRGDAAYMPRADTDADGCLTATDEAVLFDLIIDIKPGSRPNSINPTSSEVIPVAILAKPFSIPMSEINLSTVRFGSTGNEAGPVTSALKDIDGDGVLDMILYFKIQETGIVCGVTSASLTAQTLAGDELRGIDAVDACDTTPPVVTISATPETLWPPNGKMVPVSVSGTMTDVDSGVNANTATYAVTDEYGNVQPSGHVSVGLNGSYAFTIQLEASRDGDDKDGRHYIITVSAQDNAGNQGAAATGVTVPHDQGK